MVGLMRTVGLSYSNFPSMSSFDQSLGSDRRKVRALLDCAKHLPRVSI